ncbi:PTS sugar transporter subunit IIA [Streptococcus orisasini]
MKNDLFAVYLNQNLKSRKDVYDFLAQFIATDSSLTVEEIKEQFLKREKLGNIQIADKTIMPHFDSRGISNRIIIIRTACPIAQWSSIIGETELIVALVFNQETKASEKEQFNQFIKKLTSADFIDHLLRDNQEQITKLCHE